MAAIFAVKDALRQAGAVLLEPIMAVERVAPDEYRGDLLGDLNRRRGRIVDARCQYMRGGAFDNYPRDMPTKLRFYLC